MINIAWQWDGETTEAKLMLNSLVFTGNPVDVENVFDRLNTLRDRCRTLETKLKEVRNLITHMERVL